MPATPGAAPMEQGTTGQKTTRRTDTGEVDMGQAALSQAALSQAELSQAQLSQAQPSQAGMRRADLRQADSGRADKVQEDRGPAAAGEAATGQTAAGQTAAGQTAAGQTAAGQTAIGRTDATQATTSEAIWPQAITAGHLLGGRVRYRQPAAGHRTGIEPVLLAASLAPRAGEAVLEAGTGAGAASLCLAARMAAQGIAVTGVALERDGALAALAGANLAEHASGIRVVVADVARGPVVAPARFHHAFANPPWHAPAGTAPPDPARRLARQAVPGLERTWAQTLAASLVHRGTLTLILPAAGLPGWMAALADAGCGSLRLLPLWPRAGRPAKLVLLRAVRGGGGACHLLPGLVLHEADGRFTAAAQAILRDAEALAWDDPPPRRAG
jgi:tRNA1(Val) A37 N6-methylase TrmN6